MLPKIRPLIGIVSGFKFQSQRDDCWAVSIHNILEELAERLDRPSLRQSEARLNRAMGYGRGLGALNIRIDRVRPAVNELIGPLGFELIEESLVGFDGLLVNLRSDGFSYPIAGMSFQYLADKPEQASLRFEGEPASSVDHTVIVLAADTEEVTVFDPMERFSKAGKGGDGLISLSTPAFLSYWSQASVEREWLMYAAPVKRRREKTLLDYTGGENAPER